MRASRLGFRFLVTGSKVGVAESVSVEGMNCDLFLVAVRQGDKREVEHLAVMPERAECRAAFVEGARHAATGRCVHKLHAYAARAPLPMMCLFSTVGVQ